MSVELVETIDSIYYYIFRPFTSLVELSLSKPVVNKKCSWSFVIGSVDVPAKPSNDVYGFFEVYTNHTLISVSYSSVPTLADYDCLIYSIPTLVTI